MKEIRINNIQIEQRDADTQEDMILVGYPILFDTPTTIGKGDNVYTEVIQRGALDGVDFNDTRLIYNHDMNKIPLARTGKTMELYVDEVGLRMRATLPNTEEARGVYTAVQRGDLENMSFAFTVSDDGHIYDAGTRTRSIHKIDKVFEVSIVPYPAYKETVVSVEARSMIEDVHSKLDSTERKDLKIQLNKLLLKGER